MALNKINLSDLVDALDEAQSEYADFFRPMLGYEAVLKLYEGIDDGVEKYLTETEDETGFEIPPDLIGFYVCSNGGVFGDLELFPMTADKSVENTIHKLNVLDKSLKESIGLDNSTLLIGKYLFGDNYVTCNIDEDGNYSYQLWDSAKQQVAITFEYLAQLVALEVSYVTDYDGFMDFVNSEEE